MGVRVGGYPLAQLQLRASSVCCMPVLRAPEEDMSINILSVRLLLIFSTLLSSVFVSRAHAQGDPFGRCARVLSRPDVFAGLRQKRNLLYCGNRDLNQVDAAATRAIVAVHGASRTAQSHAEIIEGLAVQNGFGATTSVIAPHFISKDHVSFQSLPASYDYWGGSADDSGNWPAGATATNRSSSNSYDWLDEIVRKLLNNSPNLQHIVVTGFSAGGQFVNRYAATTGVVAVAQGRGVSMSFVVGAPSTLLYLTRDRALARAADYNACPNYNKWKYGLDTPSYPVPARARVSADTIIRNMRERAIYFFVGQRDDEVAAFDESLDGSCEAELQGVTRTDRMHNYHNHLRDVFGDGFHPWVYEVPGAGHSAAATYSDPNVVDVLLRSKRPWQ